MKRLITYFSKLFSPFLGLQSREVSTVLAFTVGSPSADRRNHQLKPFIRFAAILCILMTLGVGNAWGAETLVYTLDGTVTGGSNGYATESEITQNGKDWKATGNTTMNPWRIGGKQISNVDRPIYTTFTFTEDISKVTVETGTSTLDAVNSITLIVSSSQNGGGTVTSSLGKTSSLTSTTLTFNRPDGKDWSGKYFTIVFNVSKSTNSNAYIEFKNAKFYKEDTPAYTITATRNNNDYGTVSVDGTTITATPADCYQVISGTGGYTVTSGTATVTHTGTSNTLTVTPSTDCTVQVNFEKKTVNTYVDEIQGNDDIEECDTHDAPSLDDEDYATSGTCAQQHWHFAGWTTAAYKASPEGHITTAGTSMTADGTTYYAVWAKGSAGTSATVTFKTNDNDGTSDINSSISGQVSSSSGMSSYSGTKVYEGAYGLKLGTNSATGTITCTLSSSITTKTITIDAKQYGSDTGTLSCTVNGSTTFGSTQSPNSSGGVLTFTNATSVAVSSVSISTSTKRGYVKTITVGEAAVYSDYITTCCTALGSINGSFSLSQHSPSSITL